MDILEVSRRLSDGLVSGDLLPRTIEAKVLDTDHRLPFEQDLGVDLIVEFAINERKINAAIECKSRLSSTNLKHLLHATQQVHLNRVAPGYGKLKPMIAAPYISEVLRSQLRESGVGYIDLNGTFFL